MLTDIHISGKTHPDNDTFVLRGVKGTKRFSVHFNPITGELGRMLYVCDGTRTHNYHLRSKTHQPTFNQFESAKFTAYGEWMQSEQRAAAEAQVALDAALIKERIANSAPELLAYAECAEAMYQEHAYGIDSSAILRNHGYRFGNKHQYIRDMRAAALAKARGEL